MKRLTIRIDACTEILALLIVMAWADGKLLEREKKSIRSAASVLNLPREVRDRLDGMLEEAPPLDQVIVANLGPKERSFAYVAAAWMASVDEDVDDREVARLDEVKGLLGIDDDRARELAELANELGKPHEKGGWADDLVKLFKAIPKRLEASDEDELEVAFE